MFNIKSLNGGYKKILGTIAMVVGFIALITPFTPGAFWLLFLGLELMGVDILFLHEIEKQFKSIKSKVKNKFSKKKEGL